MKMETAVRAPGPGRVRELSAVVNSHVDAGAPLLRVDPIDTGAAAERVAETRRVAFTPVEQPRGNARCAAFARLDAMSALLTGYDVSAARARTLLAEYTELRNELPGDDPELRQA